MVALPDVRSHWAERAFWLLFLPIVGVHALEQMVRLALPLILLSVTGSAVEMNAIRAITFVPNLLLAFVIGALVDRWNRKAWLAGSLLIQAATLVALAVSLDGGYRPWLVYGLVFALSTSIYGFFNAHSVAIKQSLPQHALAGAVAATAASGQFLQVLGPMLSGLLLLLADRTDGLWIAAGLALVGLPLVLALRLPETPRRSQGMAASLAEGWRALRANRPLWVLTLIIIGTNSTEGVFSITVIFQAERELGLDAAGIGLLIAGAGAGGIIGSLLAPRLRHRWSLGAIMATAAAVAGVCYATAALAGSIAFLAALMVVESAATMVFNVKVWSLRQETTPVELMGRVAGLTGSIFKLGMPFAIYAAGWVTEMHGFTTVLIAAGLTQLALAGVLLASPTLRTVR